MRRWGWAALALLLCIAFAHFCVRIVPGDGPELSVKRGGGALVVPVEGVPPAGLTDTFTQARDAGARPHDAIDIMAPRGSAVIAATDGRIEKLFCKNERALLRTKLAAGGHTVTLVPVAAILVASIQLHFLNVLLNANHRGAKVIPCDVSFRKGEEMGWFQHGSTIIVFAPESFSLCDNVREGDTIRMGQPLLRLPQSDSNRG